MSLSAKRLSSLLQTLYEATNQPQLFPEFLSALSSELLADKAYFILFDSEARCNLSLQFEFDESTSREYTEYYSKRDLLVMSLFEKLKSNREWVGTNRSLTSDSEFLSSELFNDFSRPNGQWYICAAGLDLSGSGLQEALGVSRPPEAKEFDEEAIELLAVLAPHMRQSLMLYKSLADSNINGAILEKSAQHFEHAFICLDSDGRILRMTPAAQNILARGDGLTEDHGLLRTSRAGEQESLNTIIAHSIATGSEEGLSVPCKSTPAAHRKSKSHRCGRRHSAGAFKCHGGRREGP
jgi:hypothetical protein